MNTYQNQRSFVSFLTQSLLPTAAMACLLPLLTVSMASADIFNDRIDIVIDDVSAGAPGVAAVEQVLVMADDLELEHMGGGGFDVDITPGMGDEFFVRIAHFAPIDGFPVGAFQWSLHDIQWRNADGDLLAGRITGIELPAGHTNLMPTAGLAFSDTSLVINTGGFPSSSTGADSVYRVTVTHDVLLGDVNRDGAVNLLDVAPFAALLAGGEYQIEADLNLDGAVNLLDVDPLIEELSN